MSRTYMLWSMAGDWLTNVPTNTGAVRSLTSQMKVVVFTPNVCSSNSSLLKKYLWSSVNHPWWV